MTGELPDLIFMRVGAKRFAFPAEIAREVLPLVDASPMPGWPAHALGAIDARSELMPLLDVSAGLGLPPLELRPSPRIVVVAARGGPALLRRGGRRGGSGPARAGGRQRYGGHPRRRGAAAVLSRRHLDGRRDHRGVRGGRPLFRAARAGGERVSAEDVISAVERRFGLRFQPGLRSLVADSGGGPGTGGPPRGPAGV